MGLVDHFVFIVRVVHNETEKTKMSEVKVTGEQKEVLIDFMEQHPDFAKSKLLGM